MERQARPPISVAGLTDAPGVLEMDVALIAALLSPNFGDALASLSRYKRLTCPEDIDVELNGDEARIRVRWLHASENAPNLLTDAAFAWFCRIAAVGSNGTIRPIRIELSRAEARSNVLSQYFGCPVQFNSTVDGLVFPRGSLEAPFTTRHPEMLEVISPALETALREHESSKSFEHRVCRVLTTTMGLRRPSIELVAKELRISVRTLQRRLEDEGTNYQRPAGRCETAHRSASAGVHGSRCGRDRLRAGLRGDEFVHPRLSGLGGHEPGPVADAERTAQTDRPRAVRILSRLEDELTRFDCLID